MSRKPARKPVRRRPAPDYWHGGPAGLKVGARITPPASRGPLPTAYQVADYPASAHHVYVTQDRTFARYFATLSITPGALYRVRPIGQLVPDDDYPPNARSFSCAEAIIEAVAERTVTATAALQVYGNSFTSWEDGGSMYDAAGYMQPSPQMELIGITAEHLQAFGFLPDPYAVTGHFAELLLP